MRIVPWIVLTTAVTLLGSACRARPSSDSPFPINGRSDMAAGIPFSTLRKGTEAPEIKRVYACDSLWAGGRECRVELEAGVLVATVNGQERVVRLKLETNPHMRGPAYHGPTELRAGRAQRALQLTAEIWSSIRTLEDSARGRGAVSMHWRDDRSRWSAAMWYQSLYTYLPEHWKPDMPRYQDSIAYLPDSVVTTDELTYAEFMRQRPPDPPTSPPSDPVERLRFDLEMMVSAQTEYFEGHGRYAATADSLLFAEGEGVRIRIREATRFGWSAVGTHALAPGVTCVIHVGRGTAPPATSRRPPVPIGQVVCEE